VVGPYWKNKTQNVWNIPKGHVENSENLLDCAIREFEEETGLKIPTELYTELQYLGFTKTSGNKKVVHIFALNYDFSPDSYSVNINSNMCEVEFPPNSRANYFNSRIR
jgi:predicted NUDIX family NTP pyrophosphohydrolase